MADDHAVASPREILDALSKPFPPQAIEQRKGGGGTFAYVATETVIRRLNAASPCWDFRVTGHEWAGDVLIAFGELTIPGLGTRAGTGVQRCADLSKSEDLVKGAASDALKKCATLFGVAIDLYGPDLEAGAPAPTPIRAATPATSGPAPQRLSGATAPRAVAPAPPRPAPAGGAIADTWSDFWRQARSMGVADPPALTKMIGALGTDGPDALMQRLNDHVGARVEVDPDTGEVIPDWLGRVAETDQLAGMPTPTRGRTADQIAGME